MIIAIEGVDGSGKETQARYLAERLGCGLLTFPSIGPNGRRAAELLDDEHAWNNTIRATIDFALDFLGEFGPRRHHDYVCDRYIDSYRLHARARGYPDNVVHLLDGLIPEPDVRILLDGDPEVFLSRKAADKRDRVGHERDTEFITKMSTYYKNAPGFIRVNGMRYKHAVHEDIAAKIRPLIPNSYSKKLE